MNNKGFSQIGLVLILVIGIALAVYLTQYTQIFSPKAAENSVTGQISATPNPCLITPGQSMCQTVISWSATEPVEVRLRDANRSLFASGASGSQSAPWITGNGVIFDLFQTNNGPLLASVEVKGGLNSGVISASPYPCIIPSGQTTCTTRVTWSTEYVIDPVQVKVRETGAIFATGRSGSADATWVTATPRTLDLYHDNGKLMLSSFIVKGVAGTVSPSPSPSSKIGDLNNDGKVNIFDFNIFVQHYQTRNLVADLNKNGTVDIFDFNLLVSNFGR